MPQTTAEYALWAIVSGIALVLILRAGIRHHKRLDAAGKLDAIRWAELTEDCGAPTSQANASDRKDGQP